MKRTFLSWNNEAWSCLLKHLNLAFEQDMQSRDTIEVLYNVLTSIKQIFSKQKDKNEFADV